MTGPPTDDDSDAGFGVEMPPITDHERAPAASVQPRQSLSRDDLFHVLQCRRRRLTLWYLQERATDGEASLRIIARHVAAAEEEQSIVEVDDGAAQRVHLSLCQAHLPKLEAIGVIEHDDARGVVRLTGLVDAFTPYLAPEPREYVIP